jgi:hypothetical protein
MFRIRPMLVAAAHNNAAWVAAVHAAHGHAGERKHELWLTRGGQLPLYPNMVTLTAEGVLAQTVRLRALVDAGLPAGWTIKDSYAALDLAPMGFEPLFEAQWIARPAEDNSQGQTGGLRWAKVSDAAGLAAWERAWRGQPGHDAAAPAPFFTPALLDQPDLMFLGGYIADAPDAALVAGLIANRSVTDGVEVVGVSNIFLPEGAAESVRAGALAAAETTFPGLPLAGYEHSAELEAMWAQGFVVLGPLRVWRYTGGNQR